MEGDVAAWMPEATEHGGLPLEMWAHCFALLEDVRDRAAVAAVRTAQQVNKCIN
jgi:hypothetical protein